MKTVNPSNFNFRDTILDKIMKQLEENQSIFEVEYGKGDVIKALFEEDSLGSMDMVNFKDRMGHKQTHNANSIFKEMHKKLRN